MPRSPRLTTNGTNGNGHYSSPHGGLPDLMVLNQLNQLTANITTLRREALLNRGIDPRRDLDAECGWPTNPQASDFQLLYDREPIAGRVVEVMPKESWQVTPWVYEEEDSDTATEFEQAWDELGKQLRGEFSWYKDEAGSLVWEFLRQLDVISGVGRYGVGLIGIDDGKALSEEAKPKKGQKLLYVNVFAEQQAQVTRWVTDRKDPRYAQPEAYSLTFNDPTAGGIGVPMATEEVHWSRVIHVADTGHHATGSKVFAKSRLEPVLNSILDIRKVRGGSAEMYWQGALPGLTFETHPQLGGDVELDIGEVRDAVEQYTGGLQRFLAGMGGGWKMLAPTVADPTPQILAQIEAICIKLACPKRIFMGSERGELASSQDDAAWNDRVKERQTNYLTPRLVGPFVDRLIYLGVLPTPAEKPKPSKRKRGVNQLQGYCIEWPDLASQSDAEKAGVAFQRNHGQP